MFAEHQAVMGTACGSVGVSKTSIVTDVVRQHGSLVPDRSREDIPVLMLREAELRCVESVVPSRPQRRGQ